MYLLVRLGRAESGAVSRDWPRRPAQTGVTANAALPGPTASEGVTACVGQTSDEEGTSEEEMENKSFGTARPSSLLGRFVGPEEVAAMVPSS